MKRVITVSARNRILDITLTARVSTQRYELTKDEVNDFVPHLSDLMIDVLHKARFLESPYSLIKVHK